MSRKLYKYVGLILAVVLSFSNIDLIAQATEAEVAEDDIQELDETAQYELEMQQVYNKAVESNTREGWPAGPQIFGESAIVIDMDTGTVLYEKGADETRYPASITKVLTALVAIENSTMDTPVTFSQASIDTLRPGYAHIAMRPGETITMSDALHALLLASANEAGYAIGETVAGSHEKFVEMMNEKAKELGCTNSQFVNTNGMYDPNHYTTPRDMALIAMAAFKHEEFRQIEQVLQYTIPPTNLEPEPRTFQQKHKMRRVGHRFYDERCVGGKTGYTDEASNTLITYMESEGRHLVCVDMCSRKDIFPDTKAMCDYGFSQFANMKVSDISTDLKLSEEEKEKSITLPIGVTKEQIECRQEDGSVGYYFNGTLLGTAKLQEEVKEKPAAKQKEDEKKAAVKKAEKEKEDKYMKIKVLICVILVIILIVAIGIFLTIRDKEQNKKRRYYKRMRLRRKFRR